MVTTTTTKPKTKKPASIYIEAVGRRKNAIARVRATESSKTTVSVNNKSLEEYFPRQKLRSIALAPIEREGFTGKYGLSVQVSGGGINAQAEAIRHGLARVLVKEDEKEKGGLKKLGFLKRDSRKKERKHFGLKKARKASQWSKR